MSARGVERALQRLASPGATLAPDRVGGFGVLPNGDRRRRAVARLDAADVRALEADGSISRCDDNTYTLTEAGRAHVRREAALTAEAFAAQHRPIIDRAAIDADGDARSVRGHDPAPALKRLAGLTDVNGRAWLSAAEFTAASRLRADWDLSECGLVRGSDWASPPLGSAARASNGAEQAMARRCDAGRRLHDALAGLAPMLRRVVERVCLHDDGLEALERAEAWPARSGKLALKLALSQLAASL